MILPSVSLSGKISEAVSINVALPHGRVPKLTPEDWSSLIGIITAIVGNVLISFALNTQRYAHIRLEREANLGRTRSEIDGKAQARLAEERSRKNARPIPQQSGHSSNHEEADEMDPLLPKSVDSELDSASSISAVPSDEKSNEQNERKNYLRSPYWWIGIILMVIGEAGNFLAYGFAPASIVSPLGVVALISNCLIAPIMLKEQLRKRDLLGVLIAVAGAVTVVLSAKGSNPKIGPDKIWHMIKQWEFLTYLGITCVLIIILSVASNRYGAKTIMIDVGLVGLFGGYTALATKGVASLFSYRLFDVFTFWISYLLIFVLVVTAVMQIKYVNRALQRFDSTQVIPTQFVTFTISVVVGSAILYRDFEKTTAQKVGQFVGGVFLTFLGVWIITSGRPQTSVGENYEGEEEHEIGLVDEEVVPTPSPPSTPKLNRPVQFQTHEVLASDSPASFATATSHIEPSALKFKKPAFQTASSSPTLPTSITRSSRSRSINNTPTTPSNLARSSYSAYAVSQAPTSQTLPPSNTSTPVSTSIPRLSRYSIAAGMTPGPYLSPLNAGVRIVLSDSMRRGSSSTGMPQQHQQQPPQRLPGRRRSIRPRASVPDIVVANEDSAGDVIEDPLRRVSTADESIDRQDRSTRS